MRLALSTLLVASMMVAAVADADSPSRPPLSCSTVALKTQVLPGEWFIVRFVVRNNGGSVVKVVGIDQWGTHKFRSRAVGEGWRDWGDWPPEGVPSGDPPFSELKPGEVVEKVHLLQPNWLHYPPGKYEAQLIIDYSRWPDFTKPPAGAWAGILECTPAQIEVVEPTGVDAEAFKALGPFPCPPTAGNWCVLTRHQSMRGTRSWGRSAAGSMVRRTPYCGSATIAGRASDLDPCMSVETSRRPLRSTTMKLLCRSRRSRPSSVPIPTSPSGLGFA